MTAYRHYVRQRGQAQIAVKGLVVTSSGVAGSSSFSYDGDGRMTVRTDAAGTASFGYSARGELTSVV